MTIKTVTVAVFKDYSIAVVQYGKHMDGKECDEAIRLLSLREDFAAKYPVQIELPETDAPLRVMF